LRNIGAAAMLAIAIPPDFKKNLLETVITSS